MSGRFFFSFFFFFLSTTDNYMSFDLLYQLSDLLGLTHPFTLLAIPTCALHFSASRPAGYFFAARVFGCDLGLEVEEVSLA